MFEKIENNLRKGKRTQKGRRILQKRVNITYPLNSIAIYTNQDKFIRLPQFKQLKVDLSRHLQNYFFISFLISPNKTITKKGILVRMGKGKGKLVDFGSFIPKNTICIRLTPKNHIDLDNLRLLSNILKTYPFLSFHYHF